VYHSMDLELREQRAVIFQMSDKTFKNAGSEYQQSVIDYGVTNRLMLRLPLPQPEKIIPKLPQLK